MPAAHERRPRGRPKVPDELKKRNNVTIRIRDALKAKVEQSAAEQQRSLSEEIETRLTQSFEQAQRIEDVFGSADLFRLARTIVSVMDQAGTAACAAVGLQEGVPRGWLDSPYGYEKAMDAAVRVLDLLKPPGVFEAGRTLPLKSRSREAQDEEIRQLMEAVLDATRRLPFLRERLEDRELKELRDRLGRLADRIKKEEESK